jgi:hypothetical protein
MVALQRSWYTSWFVFAELCGASGTRKNTLEEKSKILHSIGVSYVFGPRGVREVEEKTREISIRDCGERFGVVGVDRTGVVVCTVHSNKRRHRIGVKGRFGKKSYLEVLIGKEWRHSMALSNRRVG